MQQPNLEMTENRILKSVKFIDVILQEIRTENKELQDILGMRYAKYIGLTSPFEEAIHVLKKVKNEFDSYLKAVREDLATDYKERYGAGSKRSQKKRHAPLPEQG